MEKEKIKIWLITNFTQKKIKRNHKSNQVRSHLADVTKCNNVTVLQTDEDSKLLDGLDKSLNFHSNGDIIHTECHFPANHIAFAATQVHLRCMVYNENKRCSLNNDSIGSQKKTPNFAII
jgi:hypothetical protein